MLRALADQVHPAELYNPKRCVHGVDGRGQLQRKCRLMPARASVRQPGRCHICLPSPPLTVMTNKSYLDALVGVQNGLLDGELSLPQVQHVLFESSVLSDKNPLHRSKN